MAVRVGINGFGRIGRLVFRRMMEKPEAFEPILATPSQQERVADERVADERVADEPVADKPIAPSGTSAR